LRGLALMRLAVTRALVILIGLEDLLQPGHQLVDGRQRAGRSLFAARALRSLRPCRPLGPGFAWRTSLATRSLRAGFALWSCFAVRTGLAALAIRSALPRLPLRATWTRWALQAASGRILRHYRNSATII
jgi:hypothetical protein